jgi:D-serine dehydratase
MTEPTPKGFPFRDDIGIGWNVFDADVVYPLAVLRESAIDHNRATMMAYCARNGVSLAPHGKTTMAPALFRRQLDDGCWAITAANTWQARMMRLSGVDKVLIANEVVVPAEIEWLGRSLAQGFDPICYVDSVAGVGIMDEVLDRVGPVRPLPVLVEMGAVGARAGVRTVPDGLEVARAAAAASNLALTGVSGFEGLLGAVGDRSAQSVVVEFLDGIVDLAHAIAAEELFEPSPEVLVTAGGSAYFDHVVDRFSRVALGGLPHRVVIRSGCYITHDDGSYHRSSPMGEVPRTDQRERLHPAIELWGVVMSRPEPTRALAGIGKRDVSHDGQLPLAKKVLRRGGGRVEDIDPFRVVTVHDQHAFLDVAPDDPLAVGDLVGFGISHPCTTFDKWRMFVMVDDDYRVTELVPTLF